MCYIILNSGIIEHQSANFSSSFSFSNLLNHFCFHYTRRKNKNFTIKYRIYNFDVVSKISLCACILAADLALVSSLSPVRFEKLKQLLHKSSAVTLLIHNSLHTLCPLVKRKVTECNLCKLLCLKINS